MNKENLCLLLHSFRKQNIICYAYRETAFNILSTGSADGVIFFITDATANAMTAALKENNFKDVSQNGENIDAKLGPQNVKIRLVEGDKDKLLKVICQPLTINSLLFRDDGEVYDAFGGMEDIEKRRLRRTEAPIRDKNSFCTMCFELTLKKGFVPDEAVREEMKKMVTLPLAKKISFLHMIRGFTRTSRFNINYVLNAFEYDGLFTNIGTISRQKKDEIEDIFRKSEPKDILLFLCYIAGLKGEQIKSVNNLEFKKESYDMICRFIKENKTFDMTSMKNQFSKQELEAAMLIGKLTALLSGNNFEVIEAASNLFKDIETDENWKKYCHEEAPNETHDLKQNPEPVKNGVLDVSEPIETAEADGFFGGEIEEAYEDEEDDENGYTNKQSAYGLRSPADNIFLKGGSK